MGTSKELQISRLECRPEARPTDRHVSDNKSKTSVTGSGTKSVDELHGERRRTVRVQGPLEPKSAQAAVAYDTYGRRN